MNEDSDAFRLHYVQDGQRCVHSFDTLEAALESARRKLSKRPELAVWISDAERHVLLDNAAIRQRLGP